MDRGAWTLMLIFIGCRQFQVQDYKRSIIIFSNGTNTCWMPIGWWLPVLSRDTIKVLHAMAYLLCSQSIDSHHWFIVIIINIKIKRFYSMTKTLSLCNSIRIGSIIMLYSDALVRFGSHSILFVSDEKPNRHFSVYLPARFDWSIIGCTIRRLALINLKWIKHKTTF